jgi:pimeloyl-ACP methyl ester carboxylesterase
MPDGSGEGFAWKFDPNMWDKLDRSGMNMSDAGAMPPVKVPLVHLYGDKSRIIQRRATGEASFLTGDIREIEIPDSHHHVMIDQPLALVAALRTLLATWPH